MTPQDFFARISSLGVLSKSEKYPYGYALGKFVKVGIDHIASPDTGECWLHEPLLNLFDAAREAYGKPVKINAGSRTPAHEDELRSAGYHTANFASPHNLSALDCQPICAAADLQKECDAFAKCVGDAAQALKLPDPRLGLKVYEDRLVHVDLVFLFFAPYTSAPHPKDWADLQEPERSRMAAWRPGARW